jgi:hypothetical protein
VALLLGLVPAREAVIQRIQVEQGGETSVGSRILPEQPAKVVPHRLVTPTAAPGDDSVSPTAGCQHRPHHWTPNAAR